MTDKQQHSEDASQRNLAPTVSTEDFEATDIEAPIRDSNDVDSSCLGRLYQAAAIEARNHDNQPAYRVYTLLSSVAQMHLKPEDKSEPYGPWFVAKGRRTAIPDDIRGDQSIALAEIAPTIQNPGLRARIADIVWYNQRKLADMARLAIDAYCEAVQLVIDGKAQFLNDNESSRVIGQRKMLHRACQIAHSTGWKDPQASLIRDLISTIIQDTIDRRDYIEFSHTSEIALEFGIGDAGSIAESAEAFAIADGIDPHWSQDLWKLSERAHRHTGNIDDRNRYLAAVAECYVTMAEAAGGTGMVASGFLMNAIKELQSIPGTKERRQELEAKLRVAQATVPDEMSEFSTTVDLTELVDDAQERIGGKSLGHALAALACLARSPDPDELRDRARERISDAPLSTMMSSTRIDDEGKVIARVPGLLEGEDDSNALQYHIAEYEGFRRGAVAQGQIEPARNLIQAEHPVDRRNLRPIALWTPFVPADRVDLVTTGLARFIGGDMFSALHILVPQLEHSLRHMLQQTGVDTSKIKVGMTQENLTLSVMLDKMREPMEKILGPAIVFEIENLFTFDGGPAIRHQLAHGLISSNECYSTDCIYACWFIFHLYCLPLLPRWKEVLRHIDQP